MAKVVVDLAKAKELTKNDKIFLNGRNRFNYVDVGKYGSGFTIVIPTEWVVDQFGHIESPIRYIECKQLTDNMNLDFDGDATVLFGRSHVSQTGRMVFEVMNPTDAREVIVQVGWGGAFERTRGQSSQYATEAGAKAFVRRSSNGGGAGCDYWILPVDFVRGSEPRDVDALLQEVEEAEKARIERMDAEKVAKEAREKAYQEDRKRILEAIQPSIEQIQSVNNEFSYEAGESEFYYVTQADTFRNYAKYTDELIDRMSKLSKEQINLASRRSEYSPMFEGLRATCESLGYELIFGKEYISVNPKDSNNNYGLGTYNYTLESYQRLVTDLDKVVVNKREARLEAIRKAEELKRKNEMEQRRAKCKAQGYPEKFTFYNRKYGATGLSHAYVIGTDGVVREPDDNILANRNHTYKFKDWVNDADGTQVYDQVLDGEVILTYEHAYTAAPLVFDIAWADGEVTEAQMDMICGIMEEIMSYAPNVDVLDRDEQPIEGYLDDWAIERVRQRAEEAKQRLTKETPHEGAISLVGISEAVDQNKPGHSNS